MTDLLQAAKEVIRQISVEHLSENAVESLRQAINEAENAKQEPVAWMNDSTPMGVFARHKEGAKNFGCTIPLYAAPQPVKLAISEEAFNWIDANAPMFVREALAGVNMSPTEPTNMNLNCKSVQARLATSWGYVKAEKAEQEPLMITPGGGAFPFAVVGEIEQAEQEPVTEWEKLKDPQTLFVNLNRGFPAQLTPDHLLHLLNKTEQAEQEPVAWLYDWEHEGEIVTGWVTQDFETTKFNNGHNVRPLYAAAPGRDIEEAVKAERQEISKKFWGAVNSCITTDELGIEFMNKFYPVHIFGHWLDRE